VKRVTWVKRREARSKSQNERKSRNKKLTQKGEGRPPGGRGRNYVVGLVVYLWYLSRTYLGRVRLVLT